MGTADPRVRLRIFNYLRTSGIEIGTANLVASRCVGAMVRPGKLPESVIDVAAAAITSNTTLDHMDETKSFALLEPRAEPYEAWPARSKDIGSTSPKFGGVLSGGISNTTLTSSRKFGAPSSGSFRAPIGGTGSTDFAIIEPIISRREITARKGVRLSRIQLQGLTGEISRKLPG